MQRIIQKLVIFSEELIKDDFILTLGRVEQVRYFYTAVANQLFLGQELAIRPRNKMEAEKIIALEIDKVYCLKFGSEPPTFDDPKKNFGSVYVTFSTGKKKTFPCGTELEIKRTQVFMDEYEEDDYYGDQLYA